MCGRYTLSTPIRELSASFLVEELPLFPRYNIAPTQAVPAVRARADGQGRELVMLRWGLIPSWAKDKSKGARLINARAETATEKPAFRAAMKKRRCLIPADGFFEWVRSGGKKHPYHITLQGGGLFAFAGLWEEWQEPGGETLESCTILTTEANELVRPLHERMPVILGPEDYGPWLAPAPRTAEELQAVLRSLPSEAMRAVPVSSRVNSPKFDDPQCIQAV